MNVWVYAIAVTLGMWVAGAPDASTPSPPTYQFRILAINPDAGGSMLLVRVSPRLGMAKNWRGHVLDADDHPVKDSDAVVVSIDRDTAKVRCKLHVEMLRQYKYVRLAPP